MSVISLYFVESPLDEKNNSFAIHLTVPLVEFVVPVVARILDNMRDRPKSASKGDLLAEINTFCWMVIKNSFDLAMRGMYFPITHTFQVRVNDSFGMQVSQSRSNAEKLGSIVGTFTIGFKLKIGRTIVHVSMQFREKVFM